jgi:D-alanine-D-alanine ligase
MLHLNISPKEKDPQELNDLILKTNMLLEKKNNVGTVCYGPVEDLGALVPVTWWKTVFSDGLYLKTDGDVVEDADITKEEISLLRRIPEVLSVLSHGIYFNNINR